MLKYKSLLKGLSNSFLSKASIKSCIALSMVNFVVNPSEFFIFSDEIW